MAVAAHLPLPSDSGYKLDSVFAYHVDASPSEESKYNFVYENERLQREYNPTSTCA